MKEIAPQDAERLRDFAGRSLATFPVGLPLLGEREERFTSRELFPKFSAAIGSLNEPGLIVKGDGGTAADPAAMLGSWFHPDLAVSFHSTRLIACEVKFVQSKAPTGFISTAVGQASVYRASGYAFGIVFLLFPSPTSQLAESDLVAADQELRKLGISLIARARDGDRFLPDPRFA